MYRFFLEIAYKGTNYHGFQIQSNAYTVQGVIEKAIQRITREKKITLVGSSRTDAGVHAIQQYAHLDLDIMLEEQTYLYKINAVLPKDIVLKRIFQVKKTAHARFDAISRTYQYTLIGKRDPFLYGYAYWIQKGLDEINLELLHEGTSLLKRQESFRVFTPEEYKHYRCKIKQAYWVRKANQIIFTIQANRFLRNMVRYIVGSLLALGMGKMNLKRFQRLLNAQVHSSSLYKMPAEGLCLFGVEYPEDIINLADVERKKMIKKTE